MRARLPLLPLLSASCLALVLASTGCGHKSALDLTNDGMSAMSGGDAKTALASFDGALKELKETDPEYMRASVGRAQALVRIDPAKAAREFLELAKKNRDRIKDQDFHIVVSEFVRARKFTDAVELMHQGNLMFPKSEKMNSIKDAVIAESKKANDAAAIEALKGLGYIGK